MKVRVLNKHLIKKHPLESAVREKFKKYKKPIFVYSPRQIFVGKKRFKISDEEHHEAKKYMYSITALKSRWFTLKEW